MNLIRGYNYEVLKESETVVATFKHVNIDPFTSEISLVFQREGKEWSVAVNCIPISGNDCYPQSAYEIREISNAST